mmetsp:Transcript_104168/g.301361  ORF Transcript_104168/g.301361 Transcript_104168/m.301361 type:complete len:237 (+) Transcript_104168:27-737(+)
MRWRAAGARPVGGRRPRQRPTERRLLRRRGEPCHAACAGVLARRPPRLSGILMRSISMCRRSWEGWKPRCGNSSSKRASWKSCSENFERPTQGRISRATTATMLATEFHIRTLPPSDPTSMRSAAKLLRRTPRWRSNSRRRYVRSEQASPTRRAVASQVATTTGARAQTMTAGSGRRSGTSSRKSSRFWRRWSRSAMVGEASRLRTFRRGALPGWSASWLPISRTSRNESRSSCFS